PTPAPGNTGPVALDEPHAGRPRVGPFARYLLLQNTPLADDSTLPPPTPPAGHEPSPSRAPEPPNIAHGLKASNLHYGMTVTDGRALPDVRDGLKPSQRRILVAMNGLGLTPTGSTSKCAGIIGETMKRYHPHGDASISPALVRMAQHWNMR